MRFLFRFRVAMAAVLAALTAGAALWAFRGASVPVGALFLSAISLAVAGGVSFVHLRHAGLAALATLAPLPGLFATVSGLSTTTLAVYGAAYLAAAVVAGELVRLLLADREPGDAAAATLADLALPVSVAGIAGATIFVFWLKAPGAAPQLLAAIASVLLVVPVIGSLLPYGEGFIVAANRARESRESALRLSARIVEPRWGLSLAGATLVLAVLGWFGMIHRTSLTQPLLWSISALGLFLVAFAIARDWRDAVAIVLATAALVLVDLWLWGRATGHLTISAFGEIVLAASGAVLLMLAASDRRRRYRQAGDESAVARLRALEELGLAPWFGAGGAAAAVLPWIVVHGSNATLAAMFALDAAAAVIAAPAVATALESFVPRRRSLEDLYGRGG